MNLMSLIYVFLGGGVGCTLRYLLGVLLSVQKTGYPYSTFLANLIGCLALGIFVSTSMNKNVQLKTLISNGLLLLFWSAINNKFT